ncbi:hypothetical protein [Aeromicrobium sp.]|uniref:hypothetical protein n=1 Tax=Aeromicrobium sp. TaxID=1871063 RepID=UPI0028ADBDC0|nr:hypothetical protein [Aeromicrobium sp.]
MTDYPLVPSELEQFLRGGIDLESRILEAGTRVREKSKVAFGEALLDGRLAMMSVLNVLLKLGPTAGLQPGAGESEALGLIAAFSQGTFATETLISEGQYIKAAASLKQDLEMLARLGEIREDAQHKGTKHVPNVKFAPAGAGRIYGDLNAVAHVARPDLINLLLERKPLSDEHAAIGPIPAFVKEAAVELYTVHVWLLSEVCRELLRLYESAWDEQDGQQAELAMKFWLGAAHRLVTDGVFTQPG